MQHQLQYGECVAVCSRHFIVFSFPFLLSQFKRQIEDAPLGEEEVIELERVAEPEQNGVQHRLNSLHHHLRITCSEKRKYTAMIDNTLK